MPADLRGVNRRMSEMARGMVSLARLVGLREGKNMTFLGQGWRISITIEKPGTSTSGLQGQVFVDDFDELTV